MVTVLKNGVNYSWGNITLILFNIPIVGIVKISYKRKQTKDNNYGFGFEPTSVGYGNVEYEGSIDIYLDEWKKIVAAAPNRDALSIPPFDIPVVYGGSRVTADKDILKFCEFLEDPLEAGQGDTKLIVTIPLRIAGLSR